MMNEHTPGPWKYEYANDGNGFFHEWYTIITYQHDTIANTPRNELVDLANARLVEALHQGQEARLVRRQVDVGGAEDERLVALVPTPVEQRRGLGVGASHDDPGHPHDVELEAGGVETFDLFVLGHEHVANGVAVRGRRLVILNSDHEFATVVPIDLSRVPAAEAAVPLAIRLRSIPLPESRA